MHQVFVSIGSNINPKENIKIAMGFLDKLFDCIYSKLYETNAEGFEGNNFINCVAGFKTNLLATELRKHSRLGGVDICLLRCVHRRGCRRGKGPPLLPVWALVGCILRPGVSTCPCCIAGIVLFHVP